MEARRTVDEVFGPSQEARWLTLPYARARAEWRLRYQLHSEDPDDWYAAMALLMSERAPA